MFSESRRSSVWGCYSVASVGWLCRRVRCGTRNDARKQKCVNCGAPRPKKRVPEHRKALRDENYPAYLDLNELIHGVDEVCAVCGRGRGEMRLDRDHDHTTGYPWSGQPRGLTCRGCNLLMPRHLTPPKARQIAAYLTRVENYYAGEAA